MMKLKIKDVYIYYDFPIIFSAGSEEGDIFICLFAEETDSHLRYICVKVSPAIILELENNQKDLRTVFENSEKVFNLLLNAQSEEPVEISAVEVLEDTTPFLPDEGLFIGESQEIEADSAVRILITPITDNRGYNFISTPPGYQAETIVSASYSAGKDIFSGEPQWLTTAA
jgi:hypothetical protein